MGAEKAAKAEHQGYQQGHEDRIEFFHELLVTLVPNAFIQEDYFEAYVKYVEDRRRAQAEGRDPELVDFNPPVTDEDSLANKETTPLDGEAATLDDEGDEAAVHGDSDNDENPNV